MKYLGGTILSAAALAVMVVTGGYTDTVSVLADTATTTVTVQDGAPVLTALSLNSGSNITLTENATTTVTGTLTATDSNGCSTISSVTGVVYRSGVALGAGCSADSNNCYPVTCSVDGGTCTGGADTAADYTCTFNLLYYADPTDAGAPNAADIWTFSATGTDAGANAGSATNTSETVEVNSLLALDVTALIPYGTLAANTDTGAVNQTATITNTGNIAQDNELSSNNANGMCTDFPTCAGDTIAATQQEYSLSSFTYGVGGTDLTTSAVEVETNLAKTTTGAASTDDTFWGIGIPNGQASGSYTGQNLFTAVTED